MGRQEYEVGLHPLSTIHDCNHVCSWVTLHLSALPKALLLTPFSLEISCMQIPKGGVLPW